MLPLMVGMGVMSMMAAKNGQKGEDQDIAGQAKAHGIKLGGIDFSADRVAQTMVGRMNTLSSSKVHGDMIIDASHAQAASDAKVSAAQAGVAGQSVTAVANDTERTKAEAKGSLNRRLAAEKLQLSTDYTDNYLNAHMKKGSADFKERGSSNKGTMQALAFAQGFLGAM